MAQEFAGKHMFEFHKVYGYDFNKNYLLEGWKRS